MNWYYVVDGKQVGPIAEADFQSLVTAGTVRAETLVWHEGLAEWKPYAQLSAPAAAPSAGGIVCAECGQTFPLDSVIRFGDVWVCAACKPIFVQKVKEGAPVVGALDYAGFGIRLAAKLLDGLILGLPMLLVFFLTGMAFAKSPLVGLLIQLVFMGGSAVYTIFFLGRYGATPGKMVCKLRVVMADGGPISYGRATGRFFGDLLSGMICYIGYLMVAFDKEQRRALHDHICNTRVIKS